MTQNKPSVAIIGTRGYPSYYGGFETAVRFLAPYLTDAGWKVTVYGRSGATSHSDPERDSRVHTVLTRGFEKKAASTLTYGLTSTLHARRLRPDVALVMNVANGFWLPILKQAGIPTLVNVDGMEWERAKWGRVAKTVFKAGAHLVGKYGDALVVDSHEIGRRWSEEFARTGTFIPYGGVVPAEIFELEDGLKHGKYVLLVARFVPENTIEEFLTAVPEIAKHVPVVIVGSSGYGGNLDQRARDLSELLPQVKWLGHVHDDSRLLSLWQHAGAYFHGHSVGGTNPALVQAMAAGAPVVARDTVYNREVLGPDARFVHPSAAEIAANLIEVSKDSNEQARLIAIGRERAATSYTWERVCQGYEEQLRILARG